MEALILVIHILLAVAIIGLIMLQHGKGADAGVSFGGGASQTVFGGSGSGSFLTKLTALFACIFFATSITLALLAKQRSSNTDYSPIPSVTESINQPDDNIPNTPNSVPQQTPESDIPIE